MTLSQHIAEESEKFREEFMGDTEGLCSKAEVSKFLHSSTLRTLAWVKELIVEETNIARSENQPTSRLTSLYMRITGEGLEDKTRG